MITDVFRSPVERRQAEQFAALLEGRRTDPVPELESLLTLTAALRTTETLPSADFSTALRARLVQEAAERPTAARVPAPRRPEVAPSRPHRIRQAVAAMTAITIVGGTGAAVASTRALPGDTLYGLKRGLEAVQLSLAGSELAQGRELLEQADARLGEAERLASSTHASEADTRDRIGQALQDMDEALRAGSELLTEVYASTGDLAALELLDRFVIDQVRRLDLLLDRLAVIDPALRDEADEVARLLASLHADVMAVTDSALAMSAEGVVGAARDPRASGEGWEVSRASDHLVQSQTVVGGTGSTPSSDVGEPTGAATPGGAGGLVGGVTGDGPLDGTTVVETPDLPGPGTTSVVPSVPEPIASVATVPPVPTVPSVPVPPNPLDDAPCVPIAPLTTC